MAYHVTYATPSNIDNQTYKKIGKMGTAASSNNPKIQNKYSLLGGNINYKYNDSDNHKYSHEGVIKHGYKLPPRGPFKGDHSIKGSSKNIDFNYYTTSYSENRLKPLSKKSSSISDLRCYNTNQIHKLNNDKNISYNKKVSASKVQENNIPRNEKYTSKELLNNARSKLSKLSKGLTKPNKVDSTVHKRYSVSTNDISRLLNDTLNRNTTSEKRKKDYMVDSEAKSSLAKSSLSYQIDRKQSVSLGSQLNGGSSDDQIQKKGSGTNVSCHKFRSGLVGLRNLGNTCFMNSILQCLCRTKYLRNFFCSTNGEGIVKGKLARAFSNLVKDMWCRDDSESSISPASLKIQVQRYASRFSGTNQQDAQEFLRFFLEGLHDDLNIVTKKPIYSELDDKGLSDQEKSDIYWKRYLSRENSFIQDLFVGQLKSILTCTFCSHRSVTYDPFWDLSLPLPSKSHSSDILISKCLSMFTQEETLDGDEKPTCEKCKKRRKCTKRFLIDRFPKILVLHLKRFSGARYRTKLETKVDFPYHLNLTDFAANNGGINNKSSYTLYGVSNHMGSTHGGHYTAFCKHPDVQKWHCYNDTRVNEVSNTRIISPAAYVLFYEATGV